MQGRREGESDEGGGEGVGQVERELDLEISGSWGRFEQVLEWNRFVVGSCKVVKRKAEAQHSKSRGRNLTVSLLGKAERHNRRSLLFSRHAKN